MELNDAQELAIELMNKHGLIEKGWKFKFDHAKKRYGLCSYMRRSISLSSALTQLRNHDNIKNTILHEIAHALVGCGHGHDEVWKAKAIEIGCNGDVCSSDVTLKGDWKGICPNGHISYKHRKPKLRVSCAVCNPRDFDVDYLIVYEFKPMYSKST